MKKGPSGNTFYAAPVAQHATRRPADWPTADGQRPLDTLASRTAPLPWPPLLRRLRPARVTQRGRRQFIARHTRSTRACLHAPLRAARPPHASTLRVCRVCARRDRLGAAGAVGVHVSTTGVGGRLPRLPQRLVCLHPRAVPASEHVCARHAIVGVHGSTCAAPPRRPLFRRQRLHLRLRGRRCVARGPARPPAHCCCAVLLLLLCCCGGPRPPPPEPTPPLSLLLLLDLSRCRLGGPTPREAGDARKPPPAASKRGIRRQLRTFRGRSFLTASA